MTRKRVVIVDDSATMRAMIHQALKTDGRFEVVGEAADPFDARAAVGETGEAGHAASWHAGGQCASRPRRGRPRPPGGR